MDLNETLQSLPQVSQQYGALTMLAWCWLCMSDKQQETDAEIMLIRATTSFELFWRK